MIDDELQAIEQVLSGDVNAFRVLVDRYQQRVVRFCANMVSNRHDAEELSQEVFLSAYKSLSKFRSERAMFSTWLYTLARNCCINHLKRHRPVLAEADFEPQVTSEVDVAATQREFFALVDAALDRLPLDQKIAFILAEVEQLPYAQIAVIQQTSLGTVKSRVHRAKQSLRTILSPIRGSQ